jgi:hypothetical protein
MRNPEEIDNIYVTRESRLGMLATGEQTISHVRVEWKTGQTKMMEHITFNQLKEVQEATGKPFLTAFTEMFTQYN